MDQKGTGSNPTVGSYSNVSLKRVMLLRVLQLADSDRVSLFYVLKQIRNLCFLEGVPDVSSTAK